MLNKEFDDITLDDLQQLVTNGITEGRQIEFKRDHYGRKDKDRKEFAADISAFANAIGGFLLIGIDERNGIASEVCGVKTQNADELVRMVSQSMQTSFEPPIQDFRIRWVNIQSELGVLMIKVPRSWTSPHRVTVAKEHSFYIRDENGKHPMSVDELRRAFLFASEIEKQIRNFRTERLELLAKNEGPLAIANNDDPKLILHVVPRVSFTENIQLDLREWGARKWPWPLGASGANSMHSIDGLVSYSGPEEQFATVRAFSTLFRNGIAEAVARVHTRERDDKRDISLTSVERYVISGVRQIFGQYDKQSTPGPFSVIVSLSNVRGLSAPMRDDIAGLAYPYRADHVLLPELTIESLNDDQTSEELLRPLFDLMWNAFGRYGSPNYDQNDNYISR